MSTKYVSFLFPISIRGINAPQLWAMLSQIERMPTNEMHFIGSDDYFSNLESYEGRWDAKRWHKGFDEAKKGVSFDLIEQCIFNDLYEQFKTHNRVWKHLITNQYGPLMDALTVLLERALKKHDVPCIFTLCNCKSLEVVGKELGIPVVHFELGALRSPIYQETAYLDFTGVNGNTESASRFENFEMELKRNPKFKVLKKNEIFDFIATNPILDFEEDSGNYYKAGVAFQVEDDSNMLAFSNGFDNFESYSYATLKHSEDNVLVRLHPLGHANYNNVKVIDTSKSSLEFVHKCQSIITINSSVALEAFLTGKQTIILGDNPMNFIVDVIKNDTSEDKRRVSAAIHFFVFGYLIPFNLLFNKSYLDWRLSNPTEMEICKYHHKFYKENIVKQTRQSLLNRIMRKFKL